MIPPASFASLISLFNREEQAWEALLRALEDEAEAVKSQKLEAITTSTQKKGETIGVLSLAVEERRKFLNEIALELNLPSPLTWGVLIKYASPDQRQELTGWMEKFSAFGREVKKINEGNADLIKAAQEVVSRSLQFLQRAMGEQANYNQGGQVSAQPLQGKIVSERG